MAVITISREAASGGEEIAREVAASLGCELVDKTFMEQVLNQYGFIEFGSEYDSKLGFWDRLDIERSERREMMMRLLEQATLAVARRGNVVLIGRSSFAILAGYADVLRVRIQAPEEIRTFRYAQAHGVSMEHALAHVEKVGKVRAEFVRRFHGVDWYDSRGFDLVLDTGKLSYAFGHDVVLDAVRQIEGTEPIGMTLADAVIDPVAIAAVEDQFREMSVSD